MQQRRRSLTVVKYLGRFGSKENGFTLIELMVAFLILSILVAIAVPVFLNGKANSDRKVALYNLRVGISCHNGVLLEIFDNRPVAEENYRDFDPPGTLASTTLLVDGDGNTYAPVNARYMSTLEPRITWADIAVVDIPVVPVVGGDGGMAFAASDMTYASDGSALLANETGEPTFVPYEMYKNGEPIPGSGVSGDYKKWNLLVGKIGVVENVFYEAGKWQPNTENEYLTMLTLERSGVAHFVTFKLGTIVDSGMFAWADGTGDPGEAWAEEDEKPGDNPGDDSGDPVVDPPVEPPVVPPVVEPPVVPPVVEPPVVPPPVVPPVVILDDVEIYDLKITPVTLNLASNGVFMAHFNLPAGYSAGDIVLGSVHCSGAYAIQISGNTNIKFERQNLLNVSPGDAVVLTVTGSFSNGTPFIGTDVIRVIDKGN